MHNDRLLILSSTLEDIITSLKLIQKRFQSIKTADDFLKDERGLEKLDSVSMRLIAIGEGFKTSISSRKTSYWKNTPKYRGNKLKGSEIFCHITILISMPRRFSRFARMKLTNC